jgi:hypothetical protein
MMTGTWSRERGGRRPRTRNTSAPAPEQDDPPAAPKDRIRRHNAAPPPPVAPQHDKDPERDPLAPRHGARERQLPGKSWENPLRRARHWSLCYVSCSTTKSTEGRQDTWTGILDRTQERQVWRQIPPSKTFGIRLYE